MNGTGRMIGRGGRRRTRNWSGRGRMQEGGILEECEGNIFVMVVILSLVERISKFVGRGVTNLSAEWVGRRGRRWGLDGGHGETVKVWECKMLLERAFKVTR